MAASRLPWLVCVLVLLGAACGGGGGGTSGAGTFGYDRRVELPLLPLPFGLPEPAPVQWLDAFPGLTFFQPLAIVAVPGSDDLVVAEQGGRLLRFANNPSTTVANVILDLGDRLQAGGEEGLLGLALAPAFAVTGEVFVYYSASGPRRSVIARFLPEATPSVPGELDPASELVLLEIPQPFANHNAGCLQFGPDDMLYVASGDGGSGNDPFDNAQDLTNLLGKILRLAPDGSVPPDNPYAQTGGGVRGEIWAHGLRNPFRMSFDQQGRLWVGDVGQIDREEIDLVTRGANLGWPLYEGNRSNKNPLAVPANAFTGPVLDYGRGDGVAVIGGYVYRGTAVPDLVGAYVYADYGSGNVWGLVYDGVQVLQNTLLANVPSPASFGEDRNGELLLCCYDGKVRRLAPGIGGPTPEMPTSLADTGLFGSLATLTPVPGVIEYGVNSELWSDGAEKRRWLALPGPARIQPLDDGRLVLPVGTALVKHFEFEVAPGVVQRLETRILMHAIDGWRGYSYRWNDAGSAATLVDVDGDERTFAVAMPGDTGPHVWRFPARGECLQCHTEAAGRVLGVTVPQLARRFAYPLRDADQLGTWRFLDLFTEAVADPPADRVLVALDDPGASVDARVRSYLDTNCSFCHRAGGVSSVVLDLVRTATVDELALFGVAAQAPLPLGSGVRAIAGDHAASELWQRVARRDAFAMPPLGSQLVDPAFLDLLAGWIDEGPPPR
ncbi:MAG: PQQ-dependent sugar dehydrogenase [Planctomycetes bacterium]|nr:PQQ-dependent sugar dehydrogenase [Planctomycetota bacterium]